EPTLVSAAELADILGLREILEVGAARSAAARSLSATEREELWSRLQAAREAGPADYRRFDSQLHLYIGELVGAPSLLPVLADNRMRVNVLLDDIPLLERNIAHSNQQHEAIVIAILTGQTEQAAAAMAEHLAGSAALLSGFLG
ncbi:MAG: FCD domain-containing protein, partial [Microbacteriaceae bacterium]